MIMAVSSSEVGYAGCERVRGYYAEGGGKMISLKNLISLNDDSWQRGFAREPSSL